MHSTGYLEIATTSIVCVDGEWVCNRIWRHTYRTIRPTYV